jgi:tripartite-type tricarboxylate transporter receptor subunit TctC
MIFARLLAMTTFALALAMGTAHAQGYPNRPIRIIVPFPPGNIADHQARLVGEKISARLGQPVVIDNRAGGTGQIGMEAVARAAPDGYTLVVGQVGNFAVVPHTRKLPYDVVKDFVPVAQLSSNSLTLYTNVSVPANTLQELLAMSQDKNKVLKFGSNGEGGLTHLAMELLKAKVPITWLHAPYKGTAQVETDLVAGHIDVAFGSYSGMLPHVKAGKVKMIATSGVRRLAEAPDLPTFAEAGVPGYDVTGWFGLFAPAGTPADIIQTLNAAVVDALKQPDVAEKIRAAGSEPMPGTPDQFRATFMNSYNLWGGVVKSIGLVQQ